MTDDRSARRQTYGHTEAQITVHRRTDDCTQTYRLTDRPTMTEEASRQTGQHTDSVRKPDRPTETQTERQTDRQRHRQRDRQTDRDTDRQMKGDCVREEEDNTDRHQFPAHNPLGET